MPPPTGPTPDLRRPPRTLPDLRRPPQARTAFILLFGDAVDLDVPPPPGGGARKAEACRAVFCGSPAAPLLIQRLGRAAAAAAKAAAAEGPGAGADGGDADALVLGFVPSGEAASEEDRRLTAAAAQVVAERWKAERTIAAPPPPPGFQWAFASDDGLGGPPTAEAAEAAEAAVRLGASLGPDGAWRFRVNGSSVAAFDAAALLSPCSEPSQASCLSPVRGRPQRAACPPPPPTPTASSRPPPPPCPPTQLLALKGERRALLLQGLYCDPRPTGTSGADAPGGGGDESQGGGGEAPLSGVALLARCCALAHETRAAGASEGAVFSWAEEAAAHECAVPRGCWRDVLLTLTTRDAEHAEASCPRPPTHRAPLTLPAPAPPALHTERAAYHPP